MFVTEGGVLSKRPGTLEIPDTSFIRRPDRLWLYETEESPPKVYFLASMYDTVSADWKMFYFRPGTSTSWVAMGTIRGLDGSRVPHEADIFKGKAYIRSVPSGSDKYGTAVFDGSAPSPSTTIWGIPPPDIPARISGVITYLVNDISAVQTVFDVNDASGFPATPFSIQVEFETMNVTNVAANTLTVTRAINNTTPVSHLAGTAVLYKDWGVSDHRVDVFRRWLYTYAYVSLTGHVSSRAPVENNPDELPSSTGPFIDLVPKLTVQGDADTVNLPFINVYRTSDGGGGFRFLEQIPNTGAGDITYLDDSRESGVGGGTFNDPIADDELDTAQFAPGLVVNLPPPPFEEGTLGVTDPQEGSRIVEFAGRLWYAIGSRLFYSGNEEIEEGRPQEAFPEDNFFDYQFPVTNLESTDDALYVMTLQRIFRITGINRETFNSRPIYNSTGAPFGNARAITSYDGNVAFLTHDFRVVIISPGGQKMTVSDPLSADIVDQSNLTSATFDLMHWTDLEKDWIFVTGHVPDGTLASKQWVFDVKKSSEVSKPFWFVPWQIESVAQMSGRVAEDTSQRRAVFAIWDPTTQQGRLVRLDPTVRTQTEVKPDGTTSGFDFQMDTNLFKVPPGNHMNALRSPTHTPSIYGFRLERTQFPGDIDPDAYYYKDDFWTDPIQIQNWEDPPRHEQGKGFKTLEAFPNDSGYRVALRLQGVQSTNLVEIHSIVFVWNPEAGA